MFIREFEKFGLKSIRQNLINLAVKILILLTLGSRTLAGKDVTPADKPIMYEMDSYDFDDYVERTLNDLFEGVQLEDPHLVRYVKAHVRFPAPHSECYILSEPEVNDFSESGQSSLVVQLLQGKRHGFFLEVGAGDGENCSKTLTLEKDYDWTGILIESNPTYYEAITTKHRKAFSINAGVSLDTTAKYEHFIKEKGMSRITKKTENSITIKTFPLFTILLALDVLHIDFFSLDIVGDELKVLKTIPWDRVTILIMCVEVTDDEAGEEAVVQFMEDQGYIYWERRDRDVWLIHPKLL